MPITSSIRPPICSTEVPTNSSEWVEASRTAPSLHPMNHHGVHGLAASGVPPIEPLPVRHTRLCWRSLVAAAVACIASFGLGFWVSGRRLESRALESGRRQVEEFVIFADSLGLIDRQKLEEAVITASEAEWEDRDAAQREGLGKQ